MQRAGRVQRINGLVPTTLLGAEPGLYLIGIGREHVWQSELVTVREGISECRMSVQEVPAGAGLQVQVLGPGSTPLADLKFRLLDLSALHGRFRRVPGRLRSGGSYLLKSAEFFGGSNEGFWLLECVSRQQGRVWAQVEPTQKHVYLDLEIR